LVLYDQLSDDGRSKSVQEMISSNRQSMSELFVRQGGLYDLVGGVGEPGIILSTPVFFSRDGEKIVGAVVSEYLWRDFLRNAANPSFSDLVDIVIESSCGGSFTFRLNSANELVPVANEDIHEERFEALHQTSLYSDMELILQPPSSERNETGAACRYRYSVYATSELEAQFQTSNPSLTAAVTFVLFFVIALLSGAGDYLIAKRHGKVFEAAKRSTKIVSSLFPKSCRGRLYSEAADGGSICTGGASSTAGKSATGSWKGGGVGCDNSTVPCTNSTVSGSGYSTTKKLRSMDHQRSLLRSFLEASPGAETSDMEAIADFYPEATVMMLDIQGFTAWSSEREPAMVFKLLETIFRSFDEATRRFGVFKVWETKPTQFRRQ
jgi:Adenylate and Guanylate cyclase catalytic domain